MNSIDPDTTYVTITLVMDIVSRLYQIAYILLFSYGNDINPAKPSIGKEYHGDIKNAYWINAGDLKKVIKVLGSNGEWQVISEMYTVKTPLNSYNLEVNTDHTFFVKGIGGLDGVWVHNKNCFTAHGDNPTVEIIDGHQVTYSDYQIGLDLNKQPIINCINHNSGWEDYRSCYQGW
ncbi:polymorphic toxin-type HINT domain-containing protein [Faucicola mancuniensis]|uniref:polymorphic toxin-type HINT domain-containing protein n=1 Tax=Faucicola mancuniensis TaxID=1309795 RepID=UPI003977C363